MVSLTLNRVASRASAPAARRSGVFRGPRTIVFAQEPRFTLENSKRAAEGYVEKDTAGQSNMYPTVMKPFEAGSSADTVKQDTYNTGIAVGGAVVALGAIGLGLTALLNTGTGSKTAPVAEDFSAYQPLSVYAARFSAELAPPAPLAAAVVPAPELAAAEPAAAEAAPAVASE